MKHYLALLSLATLIAAFSASAQNKNEPLATLNMSDPSGPKTEDVSTRWTCGGNRSHTVNMSFSNKGKKSELKTLRIDGREYANDVVKKFPLDNSHLMEPYLLCVEAGVVVGVKAIDSVSFKKRIVEISVTPATKNVSIRELAIDNH